MNLAFHCAVATTPIRAYSEDEPRDADGKWTSGGSIEGTDKDPAGDSGHFDPATGGILYHGTGASRFKTKPGAMYTAADYNETHAFARGEVPGAGSGKDPKVMKLRAAPGKTLDVSSAINDAVENGDDPEFTDIFNRARDAGARYVTFSHPSSVNDGEFPVVVSLYPDKDLKSLGGWRIGKGIKSGVEMRRRLRAYSEDEPRNDKGEWTDGGESGQHESSERQLRPVPAYSLVGKDGVHDTYAGISDDVWDDWAQSPYPYRDVVDGKTPTYDGYGSKFTKEGLERLRQDAHAIQKAASTHAITSQNLWRGESYATEADVLKKYAKGSTYTTPTLLSTSLTDKYVNNYAKSDIAEPVAVMVLLQNRHGHVGIQTAPMGTPSNEVIVPGGQKYRVASVRKTGDKQYLVNLYSTKKHVGVVRVDDQKYAKQMKAYSDDEPRDDRGRWTSGDGGSVFVSPNVEENLNLDDAVKAMSSARQKAFETKERDVVSSLNGSGKIQTAVGVWADGAENSSRIFTPGLTGGDKLRYMASLLGKAAQQKQVLVWSPKSEGSHLLYSLSVTGKSPQQIVKDATEAGIEHKTIVPDGKSSKVYILDMDGSAADKVSSLSSKTGYSGLRHEFGEGEFIGDENSREKGEQEYDKVIQDYEKHNAPYKGGLRFRGDQTRRRPDIRGWRSASTEKEVRAGGRGRRPEIGNFLMRRVKKSGAQSSHYHLYKTKNKDWTVTHEGNVEAQGICVCGHSVNKHRPPDFVCGWCADCVGFRSGVAAGAPHPFVGKKNAKGEGVGDCEECGKPFKNEAHWRIAAGGPGSGWFAEEGHVPHASYAAKLTPMPKITQLGNRGFKLVYMSPEKEVWHNGGAGLQVHVSKYNSPTQPGLRKYTVLTPTSKLSTGHQFGKTVEALVNHVKNNMSQEMKEAVEKAEQQDALKKTQEESKVLEPSVPAYTKNKKLIDLGYKVTQNMTMPNGSAADVWTKDGTSVSVRVISDGGTSSKYDILHDGKVVKSGDIANVMKMQVKAVENNGPSVFSDTSSDVVAPEPSSVAKLPSYIGQNDAVFRSKVNDAVKGALDKYKDATGGHDASYRSSSIVNWSAEFNKMVADGAKPDQETSIKAAEGNGLYAEAAAAVGISGDQVRSAQALIQDWTNGSSQSYRDAFQKVVDGAVDADPGLVLEHAITQAKLKMQNPKETEITLYRGLKAKDGTTSDSVAALKALQNFAHFDVGFKTKGAESWTSSEAKALDFKGSHSDSVVISTKVPIQNVMTSYVTNPTSFSKFPKEQEFVVAYPGRVVQLHHERSKIMASSVPALQAFSILRKAGWGVSVSGKKITLTPPSPDYDWLREDRGVKAAAYKLAGRTEFQGLKISIENKKGDVRSGVDNDGKPWSIKMPFDYGYIIGTKGMDNQHVDCFIGPDAHAKFAYIVHQTKKGSSEYDEDKVMLGFPTANAAEKAYRSAYTGFDFFGSMTILPMHEFIEKVKATAKRKRPGKIHARTDIMDIRFHAAIKAGGPGSGRHPEGGATREAIESFLQKGGYVRDQHGSPSASSDSIWTREVREDDGDDDPSDDMGHTRHTVVVHPNGSWEHFSEGTHMGSGIGRLAHLGLRAKGRSRRGKGLDMLKVSLRRM